MDSLKLTRLGHLGTLTELENSATAAQKIPEKRVLAMEWRESKAETSWLAKKSLNLVTTLHYFSKLFANSFFPNLNGIGGTILARTSIPCRLMVAGTDLLDRS